jgi:hypothetical protein
MTKRKDRSVLRFSTINRVMVANLRVSGNILAICYGIPMVVKNRDPGIIEVVRPLPEMSELA